MKKLLFAVLLFIGLAAAAPVAQAGQFARVYTPRGVIYAHKSQLYYPYAYGYGHHHRHHHYRSYAYGRYYGRSYAGYPYYSNYGYYRPSCGYHRPHVSVAFGF